MKAPAAATAVLLATSAAAQTPATTAALADTRWAVVVGEATALRAAPRESAAQQAVLWPGDLVELRGARLDHLQVWDHRRERAGFIRETALRPLPMGDAAAAPQLLAVLRFLREQPGAESLGIAYAAAYLKAAPQLDPEAFDAIGQMAERLARRASQRSPSTAAAAATAAQMEVAQQYGIAFSTYEREGGNLLCPDGAAYRRVLALNAMPEARARAALGLTRHDCIAPDLSPSARAAHDAWRMQVLDALPAAQAAGLSELSRNRLRLRRSGVLAGIAHARAHAGDTAGAAQAASRALLELAAVNKAELTDDDQAEAQDAAIRVGASRWAVEPAPADGAAPGAQRLHVRAEPGEIGQTCVALHDPAGAVLLRRCTWGVAWMSSARVDASGQTLALAVQPLPAWTELWLFRRGPEGWQVEVLPPAASEPGLGYAEFAGWVPGTAQKLLLVREARADGRIQRRFEVLALDTLATERQASRPDLLVLFGRHADARWRAQTVSLR